MTTIDTSIIRPIEDKLSKLRLNRLFWILVDGLTRVWISLLGLTALSMLVDWYFRLDLSQRVLLMVVSIVFLAWVAYRRIIRPIRVNLTDDVLLRTVEDQYGKESHEAVISAVQLARRPHDPQLNMSEAMMRETIYHGVDVARDLDFSSVIDGKKFSKNMLLSTLGVFLVCAVLILAAFHDGTRKFLSTWFPRNVLMSHTVNWTELTELYLVGANVVDGKLVMTRGDDLTLLVNMKYNGVGSQPSVVMVRYRTTEGGSWTTERMDMKADHFTYRIPTVLEPITLRFSGGDTKRIRIDSNGTQNAVDEIQVELRPRPELEEGSLQVKVSPPSYTHGTENGDQYELDMSLPIHEVLYGSTLVIKGKSANKDLKRVLLDRTLSEEPPLELNFEGSGQRDFEITLPSERLEKGNWTLTLVDTEGIRNDPPINISLRMKRDMAPTVSNQLSGIGDRILETAILPMTVEVSDDHAVKGLRLLIMADAKGSQTYDAIDYTPDIKKMIEMSEGSAGDFGFAQRLNIIEDLSLLLEPDTVLTLYVEAWDGKDIETPFDRKYRGIISEDNMKKWDIPMPPSLSNVSLPRTVSVRVVTLEEFTQYLSSREKDLGSEFNDLLREQQKLYADTAVIRGAVKTMRNIESSGKGYWAQLGSMEKSQRAIKRRLGEIAGQYESMIEEVNNNRMPGAEAYDNLIPRVIMPLRDLSNENGLADLLAVRMGATRKMGSDFTKRDELFKQVLADQEEMIRRMEWIRERMKTLGEFQEAVNYLRDMANKAGLNEEELNKYIKQLQDTILKDDVFKDVFE